MTRSARRQQAGSPAIGDRIRRLRRQKGMTQFDLACAIDCTQNIISFWENGDVWPSLKFIVQIVELFGCDAHWLLFGDAWYP